MILFIEALHDLLWQKSSNTWKYVFCIANNIYFTRRNIFMYLSFTLKIALSKFLSLRKKAFSICGLDLLSALNTALVFLEVKLVILCLEALTWLALQKALIHGYLSSALQITFNFMRKKHLSCTWALLLNCIKQLSLTEKEPFSICGLAFASALQITFNFMRKKKIHVLELYS